MIAQAVQVQGTLTRFARPVFSKAQYPSTISNAGQISKAQYPSTLSDAGQISGLFLVRGLMNASFYIMNKIAFVSHGSCCRLQTADCCRP